MDCRGRQILRREAWGVQVVIRLNGTDDWRIDHIKLSGYTSIGK
jgi:hypothetical protein